MTKTDNHIESRFGMRRVTAILGLSTVALFVIAYVLFALLNRDFDPWNDYVSKLGAVGQPNAYLWNAIGFLTVGILLTAFGISFGRMIDDPLVTGLMAFFGIGFSLTAIPVDLADSTAAISSIHTASICLGVACWFFALARMAKLPLLGTFVHRSANVAATLSILPIIGLGLGLWSMPMTHRLVFLVVLGWITSQSIQFLRKTDLDSGPANGLAH